MKIGKVNIINQKDVVIDVKDYIDEKIEELLKDNLSLDISIIRPYKEHYSNMEALSITVNYKGKIITQDSIDINKLVD